MADTVNSIIKISVDTEDNWSGSTSRTLGKAEIALIEDEEGQILNRFKIGDGSSSWGDLPDRHFTYAEAVKIGAASASFEGGTASFSALPLDSLGEGVGRSVDDIKTASLSFNNQKLTVTLTKNGDGTITSSPVDIPVSGIKGVSFSGNTLVITSSDDQPYSVEIDFGNSFVPISWTGSASSVFSGTSNRAISADYATSSGKLSVSNTGNTNTPVYFSSGVPQACGYNLKTISDNVSELQSTGSSLSASVTTLQGYFTSNGTASRAVSASRLSSDGSTGSDTRFIYFNNGIPVASSGNIGEDGKPVYLDNGQFKTCSKITVPTEGSQASLDISSGGQSVHIETGSISASQYIVTSHISESANNVVIKTGTVVTGSLGVTGNITATGLTGSVIKSTGNAEVGEDLVVGLTTLRTVSNELSSSKSIKVPGITDTGDATVQGKLTVSGEITGSNISGSGTVYAKTLNVDGITLQKTSSKLSVSNGIATPTMSAMNVEVNGNLTTQYIVEEGNVVYIAPLGSGEYAACFYKDSSTNWGRTELQGALDAGDISCGNVTASNISVSGNITGSTLNLSGGISAGGNISTSGDLIAVNASDRRLKESIKPIDYTEAQRVITSLRPVTFTWNSKAEELSEGQRTGVSRGFIADEFLNVLPNAGRKVWGEYDAVYYEQVIPYLVSIVQQQQVEIEELKRRLND